MKTTMSRRWCPCTYHEISILNDSAVFVKQKVLIYQILYSIITRTFSMNVHFHNPFDLSDYLGHVFDNNHRHHLYNCFDLCV